MHTKGDKRWIEKGKQVRKFFIGHLVVTEVTEVNVCLRDVVPAYVFLLLHCFIVGYSCFIIVLQ